MTNSGAWTLVINRVSRNLWVIAECLDASRDRRGVDEDVPVGVPGRRLDLISGICHSPQEVAWEHLSRGSRLDKGHRRRERALTPQARRRRTANHGGAS